MRVRSSVYQNMIRKIAKSERALNILQLVNDTSLVMYELGRLVMVGFIVLALTNSDDSTLRLKVRLAATSAAAIVAGSAGLVAVEKPTSDAVRLQK